MLLTPPILQRQTPRIKKVLLLLAFAGFNVFSFLKLLIDILKTFRARLPFVGLLSRTRDYDRLFKMIDRVVQRRNGPRGGAWLPKCVGIDNSIDYVPKMVF